MPQDMHRHKLFFYHAIAYGTAGHSRLSTGIIAVHLVQRLYVLPVNGHDPASIRTWLLNRHTIDLIRFFTAILPLKILLSIAYKI
jgi:hypothetical protein